MKSSNDPRHVARQKLVEELFKIEFHDQKVNPSAQEIMDNVDAIDKSITEAAPQFTIDKINKVDLAILRLAVYELTINKKEPKKVIVDEAIELAKEYGGETSPAFINGALGNIIAHE